MQASVLGTLSKLLPDMEVDTFIPGAFIISSYATLCYKSKLCAGIDTMASRL